QATVMPAMGTVDKLSPPVARALLLGHLQAQAELQSREILQECARRDEGLPVGEKKWDCPEVRAAVAAPAVYQIFTDRDPESASPKQRAAQRRHKRRAEKKRQEGQELQAEAPAEQPRRVEGTDLGVGDPDELRRLYDNIRQAAEERARAAQRKDTRRKDDGRP